MSLPRKSDPSEVQSQNAQDHIRTFDPSASQLMGDILKELKKMNQYLMLMTDEEL